MRVQKTITLSLEVAEELEGEDNQSETVDNALRDWYEL